MERPQESDVLYKISKNVLHPTILNGLSGEGYGDCFDVTNEQVGDSPAGSDVFNAINRAYLLLRQNPNQALTSQVIKKPEELSNIGGIFLDLVNGTRTRNQLEAYNFVSLGFTSKTKACSDAEGNYLQASGIDNNGTATTYPRHRRAKNTVFVDSHNNPVLFKKTYGERSAISLARISINAVSYPQGTLFATKEHRGLNSVLEKTDNKFLIKNVDQITKISPLRLSKFVLPKAEQIRAFTRRGSFEEATQAFGFGDTYELDDLKSLLPFASDLNFLQHQPRSRGYLRSSAWVPAEELSS